MNFMKYASFKLGWAFVYVNKNDKETPEQIMEFKRRHPKILRQKFVP